MEIEPQLQRAQLLIAQNRFAQAEQVVGQVLAQAPDHWYAHGIMALCLSQDRDRLNEATREAELSIHYAPSHAWTHYILAIVWEKRNQNDKAIEAISQAIALDPSDAQYQGLAAYIYTKQERWPQALQAAETGLQIDPEDEQCSAARAFALERMGKVHDALSEADRAVRNAPDSATAHASRGWALLNSGKYKDAQIAFREALRLDPSSDFARRGMMQALNSSNPIFRACHHVMIWISRQGPQFRWIIVLVAIFGINGLRTLAKTYPALDPWITPISVTYLMFVLMTWSLYPLFNTMLRFHPFGKHLLSRSETWLSNIIAGIVALGILVGIGSYVLHRVPDASVMLAMITFMMVIPVVTAFHCSVPWARTVAIVFAIGFTLTYLLIGILVIAGTPFPVLALLFILGIVFYSFFSGYLQTRQVVY